MTSALPAGPSRPAPRHPQPTQSVSTYSRVAPALQAVPCRLGHDGEPRRCQPRCLLLAAPDAALRSARCTPCCRRLRRRRCRRHCRPCRCCSARLAHQQCAPQLPDDGTVRRTVVPWPSSHHQPAAAAADLHSHATIAPPLPAPCPARRATTRLCCCSRRPPSRAARSRTMTPRPWPLRVGLATGRRGWRRTGPWALCCVPPPAASGSSTLPMLVCCCPLVILPWGPGCRHLQRVRAAVARAQPAAAQVRVQRRLWRGAPAGAPRTLPHALCPCLMLCPLRSITYDIGDLYSWVDNMPDLRCALCCAAAARACPSPLRP